MLIINIIAAPVVKKAISYDPIADELIIEKADIIGLMEVANPEAPDEMATVPMYLCSDNMGVYFPPQLSIMFLELVDSIENIDLSKYKDLIEEIKKVYAEMENSTETVEVEQKGNVSHIRRIIRSKKNKEEPK